MILLSNYSFAAAPTLEITVGGETRSFIREELLKRPDAVTIEVMKDIAYGDPMTYRAVPVTGLLAGMEVPPDNVLEATATDGFVAEIPAELALNIDASKALAWLAIEPADQPWPKMPGKDQTAGLYRVDGT